MKKAVISRIEKTENVKWQEFKFVQKDNFKQATPEELQRLKASITSNNFVEPFYVWQDSLTGDMYCLEGKHRTMMLRQLAGDGVDIPDLLPATFVKCDSLNEAAKLVTIYSSVYAKVTQQGFHEFLQEYDFSFKDLQDEISLPEFSNERYVQAYDVYGIKGSEIDEEAADYEEIETTKVRAGDVFRLNEHVLICTSFENTELMQQYFTKKARCVLTDPPYNLAANDIGNKGKTKHADFAMGAGEMTEVEFKDFLAKMMKEACRYSLDGAIHYYFMDWRHAWHVTEAGMEVYGSPIPKQLCVWNKDVMANGSFYRSKHELCFVYLFKHGKAKHVSNINLFDRIRANMWNYPSAQSRNNPDWDMLKEHPTPKPVSMLADAILDTSNKGDVLIDFFGGSGSFLVACGTTGRVGYCTEIEPKYTHLIITRYKRYCEANGIEFKFEHVNGELTAEHFKTRANG